jgi:hypothetical protein
VYLYVSKQEFSASSWRSNQGYIGSVRAVMHNIAALLRDHCCGGKSTTHCVCVVVVVELHVTVNYIKIPSVVQQCSGCKFMSPATVKCNVGLHVNSPMLH